MAELKEKAQRILDEKEAKIKPENLVVGTSFFDVEGTATSDANAASGDLIADKTAYVNGTKVTGTRTKLNSYSDDDAAITNLTSSVKLSSITSDEIALDANKEIGLSVSNNKLASRIGVTSDRIKRGVTILGIEGTVDPDKPDQSKICTPTTSQQIITADEGYELSQVTVNGVTSAIDNNIVAENIKEDVTILGVTGTFKGGEDLESELSAQEQLIQELKTALKNKTAGSGVKLFDTIEHMQQDTSAKEGDLAMVYREEIQPVQEDSEFDSCVFPNTVILDTAFSGNTYGRFRVVDGSYFDGMVDVSSSEFRFDGYGDSGEIRVQYTSQDGITYTRIDGGDELQEFGSVIKYEPMHPWNDVIGNFMKIGGNYFEGLYKYSTNTLSDTTYGVMPLSNMQLDTVNKTATYSGGLVGKYSIEDLYKAFEDVVNNSGKDIQSAYVTFKDGKLCFISFAPSSSGYTTHNIDFCYRWDLQRYEICPDYSYTGTTIVIEYNMNNKSFDIVIDKYQTYNRDDYFKNNIEYAFETQPFIISNMDDNISAYFKPITYYWSTDDGTNRDTLDVDNLPSTLLYNEPRYIFAPTQLNALNTNVYGKIFYGKNGVQTGELASKISNSFIDTTADIYGKAQQYYDTLTPKILDNNDNRWVNGNTQIIPTKSDGTPLLDTSNLTNGSQMFVSCKNLKVVAQIDTSNMSDVSGMFQWCSSLRYIPMLNTSNAGNMAQMFQNCSSLTNIPELDTSKAYQLYGMFQGCSSIINAPNLNTSNCTRFHWMFQDCKSLVNVPIYNVSKAELMGDMFAGCNLLSNASLNNILSMCANATKMTSNKTLKNLGLTQEQATTCTTLSNYQAFVNAGWTTGY